MEILQFMKITQLILCIIFTHLKMTTTQVTVAGFATLLWHCYIFQYNMITEFSPKFASINWLTVLLIYSILFALKEDNFQHKNHKCQAVENWNNQLIKFWNWWKMPVPKSIRKALFKCNKLSLTSFPSSGSKFSSGSFFTRADMKLRETDRSFR